MIPARALYIHTPFCVQKCPYCDFYKVARNDAGADPEPGRAWLRALRAEAAMRKETAGPLRTIFVGGGTPSALTVAELDELFAILHETFDLGAIEEFTVEANPNSLTREKAARLAAGGVNRVSVGAQSFDERVLAFLGRAHRRADIPQALTHALEAGITNVSLDLIAALGPASGVAEPERTRSDLETVLKHPVLQPALKHISVYTLVIEPGTPFFTRAQRGEALAPEEEVEASCYRLIHEQLAAAGFAPYEVSNFARPGFECRHNLAYWRSEPYLGLGPSAHSFDGGRRRANVRDLRRYIRAFDPQVGGGLSQTAATQTEGFEEESLRAEQLVAERLMMGLRLFEGVDLAAVGEAAARHAQAHAHDGAQGSPQAWCALAEALEPVFAPFVEAGWLSWEAPRLAPTESGIMLVDRIVLELASALDALEARG